MNTVHKISNITSDETIGDVIVREGDGKECYLHKLVADRTYEDGTTDVQTTCVLNQDEYDEVQQSGQYHVCDNEPNEEYEKIYRMSDIVPEDKELIVKMLREMKSGR